MNKKRLKQIEDIATNILEETGCYQVPVKLNLVAEGLGIGLESYDFGEDVSGVYFNDGTKTMIGYNMYNSDRRQRFTIAHELGHHALGHKRDGVFIDNPSKYVTMLFRDSNSSTGEFLQEREANAFAAALLMPKPLLDKTIRECYNNNPSDFLREDFDMVNELCTKFEVSKQAMSLRLTNLDMSW
jgi:Zn-dependent peptidase ImmA (M78 family)